MGFCYFNNIAIAARHLQHCHDVHRIAIVDWDVHHCNGTQHAFERDRSVLVCSLHQFSPGFFPGTGARRETGLGEGAGYTLNIPVPPGFGDSEYKWLCDEQLRPAVDRFQPEFIFVSAGFDAHHDDPLADVLLTEDGFEHLSAVVVRLAAEHCDGRLVSVLEGGYDLAALSASVQRHVEALLG